MGLNLEPVPENPAKKKQIAFAVTALAIILMALALVTKSWLAPGEPLEGGAGVWSYEIGLEGNVLKSGSNKEMIEELNRILPASKSRGPAFWITGYVILFAGTCAILSLAAAAILVAKGRFFVGSIAPTSIALLFLFLALIAGGVFMATNPTQGTNLRLGTGWGFAVFGAGVVLGIVAAQMLTKFKPADDLAAY